MDRIPVFPQTASVQEMQRNYRKLLDKVKSSKNPLFILRNNVPEVVVIDVASWGKIAEKLVEKEYRESRKAIATFQNERKERTLKTLRTSLAKLMR